MLVRRACAKAQGRDHGEHLMADYTQVVVLASQKGGSGKTTLAGHIAVQAENSGAGPVAIIDTDPQGSLAKWWNVRESDTPAFAQASIPNLAQDIEYLRDAGTRLIIVDTPPAVTSSIVEVVTYADLVIVPTRPSPHDLRAVGATVDIVEHQRKPLVFVVNSATMRARITGETAVALSQHGTVAPATIHHRVDFAASMIDGRTVQEVDAESRSAKEIADLWVYLNDRLKRLRDGPIAARMASDPIREPELPMLLAEEEDVPVVSTWDGVDRRKRDVGPPTNVPDRRRGQVVFGRRAPEWNEQSEYKNG
jgi:chromosome partitioning protein